jgi:hypothetical protein
VSVCEQAVDSFPKETLDRFDKGRLGVVGSADFKMRRSMPVAKDMAKSALSFPKIQAL